VPIYEIGERDGSCYFSMKFVEGGQLDEVVKREPMSTRRAAELLVKIARTVQFAHENGILHRDIKPGNILLDRHGEPHLSDFGLAEDLERWLQHEPIRARRIGLFSRGRKWLQRNPTTAVSAVSLAGLIAAVGVIIWKSDLIRPPPTTGIAVLPFENLSEDKE